MFVALTDNDKEVIRSRAKSQRKATLAYYRAIFPEGAIADECWKTIIGVGAINDCKLGSIRRACSELKSDGFLEILEHERDKADSGRKNCKYKYIPQPGVQLEVF